MAAFTNTGADVVQRQVADGIPRPISITLKEMYEVSRCVAWVRKGCYSKVCLQFPDELLGDATDVAEAVASELGQIVYILGDTTYGSCCVDEVAAEHVGGDAVIHFGNTCLSPSRRLPVLYVPTRLPVDVSRVVGQLKDALGKEVDGAHPLVLLYDTRCHYAVGELFSKLQWLFPHLVCSTLEGIWHEENTVLNSDVEHGSHSRSDETKGSEYGNKSIDCDVLKSCKSDLKCNCFALENCQKSSGNNVNIINHNESYISNVPNSDANTSENGCREVKFSGRCVYLPHGIDFKDCSFIYLGPKGPTLESLLFRFAENTFYQVPPSNGVIEKLSGMQSLFRRSIKLEMIRDANIIGILVGTLGVARYQEAIIRLKTIIKSAGKRSYTFVVGKPNEPKLANISEVDVFVYVTCPETTLVDRAMDPFLYRKLVAPWEMEVALVAGREWSMAFEPDFSALLPGGARHMEVCEAPRQQEASISLITNRTQMLGLRDDTSNEEGTAGPVVVQEDKALATLHIGGGGQVLGRRTWAGLDPSLPPPAPGAAVVEGRKGIAAEYQDEKV